MCEDLPSLTCTASCNGNGVSKLKFVLNAVKLYDFLNALYFIRFVTTWDTVIVMLDMLPLSVAPKVEAAVSTVGQYVSCLV